MINVLQKELWSSIPYARQYGRALTGNTELTDHHLAQAVSNVLMRTPTIELLVSPAIVLPLLLIEFHTQLDADTSALHSTHALETSSPKNSDNELLYEKVDQAISTLPDLQRRVFLLVTVAKFKFNVVSRIVSEPNDRVTELFSKAHLSVSGFINSELTDQAA